MTKIIRCGNGHFYDADKTKDCPYCTRAGVDGEYTVAMPARREVVIEKNESSGKQRGISSGGSGATVSMFSRSSGTAYVTGWIVCVEGPAKGRDYRIFHGKNRVGKSYNMDICISEDAAIASVNQCALVYDGKSNQFFLLPGDGTLTYLNGSLLKTQEKLKAGDTIKTGNCIFEFVPFCRCSRRWKE